MTQAELETRLFNIAQQRAASVGRQFGEGAGPDIRALIGVGVAHILAIADPVASSNAERYTGKQIERFVDLMIEEANKIPGYPRDRLGEQTFYPARLRFCPCPPFC